MKKKHTPAALLNDESQYRTTLTRLFSEYSIEISNAREAIPFLNAYSNARGLKLKVHQSFDLPHDTPTMGRLAKMSLDGRIVLHDQDVVRLDSWLIEVLRANIKTAKVEEEPTTRTSIQDAIREKAAVVCGEIEGLIDDAIANNDYTLRLSIEMNGVIAKYVSTHLQYLITYYQEVSESSDREFVNAHKHIKVSKLLKMLNSWAEFSDTEQKKAKANRKPIKRKPKPAGVQVAKMKYLKETQYLGKDLKSVSAPTIVGSEQVWVLNTKYNSLTRYVAASRDGIQVRGTAIQNYDVEESITKKLRAKDALDVLNRVLDGGKIVLRRVLDEVKSAPKTPNGRMNENCIILRCA